MRTKHALVWTAALAVPVLALSQASIPPFGRAEPSTPVAVATASVAPAAAVNAPASQPGTPQIITVHSRPIGATTILGGTVIPYKEVTLTAQVPGRVVLLAGGEGDWFRAREILASLNKDELLAQRAAAVADLRNGAAALRAAEAEIWRQYYAGDQPMRGMESWQGLDQFTRPFRSFFGGFEQRYGGSIHRGTDVYTARARAEQAAAAIQAVRARIEQIDSRLRDSDSVSPFTGVIIKKFVEVGDTVQPGQPLLRIADIRRLQLQVEVPARMVSGLRLGMTVPVRLDVGEIMVDAQVVQIFPMADSQRHTVTVKLSLPADAPAAPGMYAEAVVPDIAPSLAELPVVPESALVWRGSLPAVFVLGPDNQPELRMVRVGEKLADGVVILSGVNVGERIVADPSPGLASG